MLKLSLIFHSCTSDIDNVSQNASIILFLKGQGVKLNHWSWKDSYCNVPWFNEDDSHHSNCSVYTKINIGFSASLITLLCLSKNLEGSNNIDAIYHIYRNTDQKQSSWPTTSSRYWSNIVFQVQTMDHDAIVFDTAPTGHTLRLLQFPSTLEKGLSKFMDLQGMMGGLIGQFASMLGAGGNMQEGLFSKLTDMKVSIHRVPLLPFYSRTAGGASYFWSRKGNRGQLLKSETHKVKPKLGA